MRIDDATLAVSLARLKATPSITVDADQVGLYLVTGHGHTVRVSDLVLALQDLHARREQDAFVVRQMLGQAPSMDYRVPQD